MSDDTWQPRTLVFDFDGTLADTPLDFARMRREAVAAMRTVADVPERDDLPTMELISLVETDLDAQTAKRLRAEADRAIRRVEVEAAANGHLFPGVREMLARCAEKDVATAIITRNCREAVLQVIPDFEDLCPCLLTRDDVPLIKPHPDHLIRALAVLGRDAQNALMVGDHPMDIQVGKAAGCRTAGVATGESKPVRLAKEEPDYLADNVIELARLFNLAPWGCLQ